MTNSVYNKELHVSVPTLDYIKQSTGLDLVLEDGTKERAEGKVYSLTQKARDYLFTGKPPMTQRVFSYLIYNGTWTQAWEQYVLRYIEATFYHGDDHSWEKTPRTVLSAIYGSVLQTNYFTESIKNEVRLSTEDF